MESEASEHGQAAELLSDWRAAARDTISAKTAARVAELALEAARAAEDAANETEIAVKAASSAVESAIRASHSAKRSAHAAAEAARIFASEADTDNTRANREVETAEQFETDARDRFHQAEDRGFTKSGG